MSLRERLLRFRFRRGIKYVPIRLGSGDLEWIKFREVTADEIFRAFGAGARPRRKEEHRRCDVTRFDQLRIAWQVANDRRFGIIEQLQMVSLCLKRWLFGR
jgi:hypothetical protein